MSLKKYVFKFSDQGSNIQISDLKKCSWAKEKNFGDGNPLLDATASTTVKVNIYILVQLYVTIHK